MYSKVLGIAPSLLDHLQGEFTSQEIQAASAGRTISLAMTCALRIAEQHPFSEQLVSFAQAFPHLPASISTQIFASVLRWRLRNICDMRQRQRLLARGKELTTVTRSRMARALGISIPKFI